MLFVFSFGSHKIFNKAETDLLFRKKNMETILQIEVYICEKSLVEILDLVSRGMERLFLSLRLK
jgi:hypothetical protein